MEPVALRFTRAAVCGGPSTAVLFASSVVDNGLCRRNGAWEETGRAATRAACGAAGPYAFAATILSSTGYR